MENEQPFSNARDIAYVRADGEKIKDVTGIHVPHPGIPPVFDRSSLLVGSRGVGKTVLLRYRKGNVYASAVHINVWEVLNSISDDAGLGGRALAFDQEQTLQIQAKSAALISIAVLREVVEADGNSFECSIEVLSPVVPRAFLSSNPCTLVELKQIWRSVRSQPINLWPAARSVSSLKDTLTDIDDRRAGSTVLFLDRAEDAPAPSIALLLGLLDQTFGILTSIAGRPGLIEQMVGEFDPNMVPGDHYDIVHLGVEPYSEAWQEFALEAVVRYVETNGGNVDNKSELEWTVRMGRDSIRLMIELAWISLETRRDLRLRARKVERVRERLLVIAKARMKPISWDFAAVLEGIRAPILPRIRSSEAQFSVEFEVEGVQYGSTLKAADTLRKALASEALFFPPGYEWHPNNLPRTFEVPPLTLWDKGALSWIA